MTLDSEAVLSDWLSRSRAIVESGPLTPRVEETGRVEAIADGIAVISGLRSAKLDELIRFADGHFGFINALEPDTVSCVLLDDLEGVHAGDRVTSTGSVVRVPVGPGLLGRVVDPLGRPLDDAGPVAAERLDPIERPAPAIVDRDFVKEPVATGIMVIDAMFAIGRGQRELVIGDRAIGKTAIALDCIINQRNTEQICIYVAIGQRATAVRHVIDAVRAHGAPQRCIFVVAPAASAPGLQWIAPFAGMTMAEYFRDRGQHALVVIDDLTKHAATHREIALLTRQPPGREAFPGDVFHVHARLLERAAKLDAAAGGGSLTALPIAELDGGNLSAYIPTNLISITDGQIVLDSRLFHDGHKPAVDIGTSVSRVGGKTQAQALRAAAETLRLDYAQFLELEIFTRFGGMSDAHVKEKIARGLRIRAALRQPQLSPLPLSHQVALLLALQEGILDQVAVEKIDQFRNHLPDILSASRAILDGIDRTGVIADADRQALVTDLRRGAELLAAAQPAAAAP